MWKWPDLTNPEKSQDNFVPLCKPFCHRHVFYTIMYERLSNNCYHVVIPTDIIPARTSFEVLNTCYLQSVKDKVVSFFIFAFVTGLTIKRQIISFSVDDSVNHIIKYYKYHFILRGKYCSNIEKNKEE